MATRKFAVTAKSDANGFSGSVPGSNSSIVIKKGETIIVERTYPTGPPTGADLADALRKMGRKVTGYSMGNLNTNNFDIKEL